MSKAEPLAQHAPEADVASRSPPLCWRCAAFMLIVCAAVAGSFVWLSIDYGSLFNWRSLGAMARFGSEFFPPDFSSAFLAKVARAAAQTLAVSALGTLLAVVAGGVLALPAAGRFGGAAQHLSRFILNLLRSVPELVWAALMVLAAGLGPFAGALALALHTTGVFGRLFAEALQNASPSAEQALRDSGSGATAALAYGTLPLALAQCLAYTLYRWEMNIRMATVLGFVGAGGLGQMLYFHLSLFQQAQAATVLLGMFVLVFVVDAISSRLRRGLAHAYA